MYEFRINTYWKLRTVIPKKGGEPKHSMTLMSATPLTKRHIVDGGKRIWYNIKPSACVESSQRVQTSWLHWWTAILWQCWRCMVGICGTHFLTTKLIAQSTGCTRKSRRIRLMTRNTQYHQPLRNAYLQGARRVSFLRHCYWNFRPRLQRRVCAAIWRCAILSLQRAIRRGQGRGVLRNSPLCPSLQSANPTVLELLFTPEDCVVLMSPPFEAVRRHRMAFLTKQCFASFGGYAVAQIQKQKDSTKMNWEGKRLERKTPLDFCFAYEDETFALAEFLRERGLTKERCGLVALNHFEHCYALYYDDSVEPVYRGIVSDDSNDVRLSSSTKRYTTIDDYQFQQIRLFASLPPIPRLRNMASGAIHSAMWTCRGISKNRWQKPPALPSVAGYGAGNRRTWHAHGSSPECAETFAYQAGRGRFGTYHCWSGGRYCAAEWSCCVVNAAGWGWWQPL